MINYGESVTSGHLPLVSIVTPVYNNENYIEECIESVLAQTYPHWEYTIVDNCSTDRSGEIADRYALSEPRIRVVHNDVFLRSVPNHNHALQQISPESKYCKMVFADDWILPHCIAEMVSLAERNPSVGIVQAYIIWTVNDRSPYKYVLKGGGFPYPSPCLPGFEVGRRVFLEGFDFIGAASSLLYRADLVKSRAQFFDEENFHSDRDTCIDLLKKCDLGFVHQVLTSNRGRPDSLNRIARDMYLDIGCMLQTLVKHGHDFLTDAEFALCLKKHVAAYYNFLAVSILRGQRDRGFWSFHTGKLSESVGFSISRLGWALIRRALIALLHPAKTVSKLMLRWRVGRLSPTATKADTEQLEIHAVGLKN